MTDSLLLGEKPTTTTTTTATATVEPPPDPRQASSGKNWSSPDDDELSTNHQQQPTDPQVSSSSSFDDQDHHDDTTSSRETPSLLSSPPPHHHPQQQQQNKFSLRVSEDLREFSHQVVHGVTVAPRVVHHGGKLTLACCGRCFRHIPQKWPRCYTFVVGVVIPLWSLIAVAMLLGLYLSALEKPQEIADNDIILADRAIFLAERVLARVVENDILDDNTVLTNVTGDEVLESLDMFANTTAFDDLSFNWIRCWNRTEVDLATVMFPSTKQIEYARHSAQLAFYAASWERSQSKLYLDNLAIFGDDATLEQKSDAFVRASQDATGGEFCEENYAGSSWFWFTVMTTVGYGNQAPSTSGGRALIWTAGFFSILLFAAVLGFAGYIFASIFDDAVRRAKLTWFATPWFGCLFWGASWFAWMLFIAYYVDDWWSRRLADQQFSDVEDALWFAYISTTTVGLGDFFLQPEVLFASDVLTFSLAYLIGFVLMSSFLGKFGELVTGLAPNLGTNLPENLARTKFLWCEPTDFGIQYSFRKSHRGKVEKDQRLAKLQKLLEQDANVARDAQTLVKEEEVIVELLKQTREKLKSLGKEEILLKSLLHQVKASQPEQANLMDLEDETLKNILRYETSQDLAATSQCSKKLMKLTNEIKEAHIETNDMGVIMEESSPLSPVSGKSILSGNVLP